MLRLATPSEMSCYTPASTGRSRSHSPAESSTALSPTQEFKELIDLTGLSSVHSPAKQSPRLSKCEWYPSWEDFINRSAAGTPTIHSDTINGLFQYFETPIDTYEQLRQLSLIVTDLKSRHRQQASHLIFAGLMEASALVKRDQKQAQGLLALVFSTFHEEFGTATSRLSVRALHVACMIYLAIGRADTALTVLEILIPLIEQDPKLVRERRHARSRLILDLYEKATLRKTYMPLKKCFPCEEIKRSVSGFHWSDEQHLMVSVKGGKEDRELSGCMMCQSLIFLVGRVRARHARTGSQYANPEQPEVYDPCLTEAARWEEVL